MKITKRQLRRIIKEERARLMEQHPLARTQPNLDPAASMTDFIAPLIADAWWEDVSSEEYEGTGPTWPDELEAAREEITDAILQSGALKAVTDIISSVDERLHNGEFAR